jgi:metal-responsive CopG/Arc/MetJ family transcriptional regulator
MPTKQRRKRNSEEMIPVTIRLPASTKRALDHHVQKEDLDRSKFIRRALRVYGLRDSVEAAAHA